MNFGTEQRKRNFFIDFFYIKLKDPNIVMQDEEVDGFAWIPMERCFELIRSGETKFPTNYDYEEIFTALKAECLGKGPKTEMERS